MSAPAEPCMVCGGTESTDENPNWGVRGGRIHRACVSQQSELGQMIAARPHPADRGMPHAVICALCWRDFSADLPRLDFTITRYDRHGKVDQAVCVPLCRECFERSGAQVDAPGMSVRHGAITDWPGPSNLWRKIRNVTPSQRARLVAAIEEAQGWRRTYADPFDRGDFDALIALLGELAR